jgi:hypothetical protein
MLSTHNEKIQNKLRSYLRSLSKRRNSRVVTADDAHTFLSRNGVNERQVRTRLSYINSVLRKPDFKPVGYTYSEREAARSRIITEWRAR